jgi:7-cyano-7-deazaguanine synthase in queuosine biosynthesis
MQAWEAEHDTEALMQETELVARLTARQQRMKHTQSMTAGCQVGFVQNQSWQMYAKQRATCTERAASQSSP